MIVRFALYDLAEGVEVASMIERRWTSSMAAEPRVGCLTPHMTRLSYAQCNRAWRWRGRQ